MGSLSQFSFNNLSVVQPTEGDARTSAEANTLARQTSIYSLTFDEFQNTWGGLGKDFGSMNMDELLKSVWTAEESLALTSNSGNDGNASVQPATNLQRQGSLTLPRTLSQKRVEEVWKDLFKDSSEKDDFNEGEFNAPQKQPTLGEITLEEFLFRAGVVREDPRPSNGLDIDVGFGFPPHGRGSSFLSNPMTNQPQNVPLNVRTSHQQPRLLPKPVGATNFTSNINSVNSNPLGIAASRNTAAVSDSRAKNDIACFNGLANGGISLLGFETKGVVLPTGSPPYQSSPNRLSGNSVESHGRKSSGALEKVVERRQRRMIKNRESAARSRERKQAYTTELEAEVEKLKELNRDLRKKQDELMNLQKNQMTGEVNRQWRGGKRICLRRTLTGPW
ncbi:hypothetical protein MLD38_032292 [Melastoma candidum]|uniref:Uncharacterized protein n=1 Tax=Melastoma candidum TaxID=119954 RepID=A0ACB9M364_9MYRT|nr:hypothetical protein MLD38_032292 [Melastoma candidum]